MALSAQSGTFNNGRARSTSDPLRNFKFQVQFVQQTGSPAGITQELAKIGFTSVEGLNMSTEMIPYREGGWNTNPHKLPGMTDFSPVTMSSGVFFTKPGMWNVAQNMFSVQWGNGTLAKNQDFRFDVIIRVFDHPITTGPGASVRGDISSPALIYRLYDAWVANVAYSGLNAMDNAVLVQQLTVHHEGLDTHFNTTLK